MHTLTLEFDPTTTVDDWEWRYAIYYPERPILVMHVFLLLRFHTGLAKFDNVEVVPLSKCMYSPPLSPIYSQRVVIYRSL